MPGDSDPLMLVLFADGASRGNPGPASLGAVLVRDGEEIARICKPLGIRTNNFAEYSAVIAGLEYVLEHGLEKQLLIKMDSKLVVEQLSGRWKIKHPDLMELARIAQSLLRQLDAKLEWIPRELNFLADEAANQALDGLDETEKPVSLAEPRASIQPVSIRAPRVGTEPTVVYVVRHGHTASTESKLISGSNDDPELSELGRRDAQAAAQAIVELSARFGLPSASLIAHSDMKRTTQTADLISKALSVPCRADSRLREISFGSWEGRSMDDLEGESLEVASWRGSVSSKPPGGESVLELEARVLRSLADLIAEHSGGAVAIVSHMMPLRSIAKKGLGSAQMSHWSLQFAPGSVSVYRFFGEELSEVFCLNSCEHLPQG
jgi:ribonuclease H / adenosylcobalamin/alpha-ribazole phosphatase